MYFSSSLDLDRLCDAVAKHLFMRREDVGVVDLHKIDQKKAAVVLQKVDGDFPVGVNVYAELDWIAPAEKEFAQLMCRTLKTSCLISDDGENPYRWLLVDADNIRPVFVNMRSFDELNAFHIDAYETAP